MTIQAMLIGRNKSPHPRRLPYRHTPLGHLVMLAVLLAVSLSLMVFMHKQAVEWDRRDASVGRLRAPPSSGAPSGLQQGSEQSAQAGAAAEPPAVELGRLVGVRDHTTRLPIEPYCYLLNLARSVAPEVLERSARTDVTIAQLLADPEKYRGQLLLLRGRLHRLIEDELPENDYGLTRRYEGWLSTVEAGNMPYVVIVTDPPVGLPLGGNILEPVEVAGYFLCWWRYSARDGRRWSAPVILGRRFRPIQVHVSSADPRSTLRYGLFFSAMIAAIVLGAVLFSLLRRTPTPAPRSEPTDEPVEFALPDSQSAEQRDE